MSSTLYIVPVAKFVAVLAQTAGCFHRATLTKSGQASTTASSKDARGKYPVAVYKSYELAGE